MPHYNYTSIYDIDLSYVRDLQGSPSVKGVHQKALHLGSDSETKRQGRRAWWFITFIPASHFCMQTLYNEVRGVKECDRGDAELAVWKGFATRA